MEGLESTTAFSRFAAALRVFGKASNMKTGDSRPKEGSGWYWNEDEPHWVASFNAQQDKYRFSLFGSILTIFTSFPSGKNSASQYLRIARLKKTLDISVSILPFSRFRCCRTIKLERVTEIHRGRCHTCRHGVEQSSSSTPAANDSLGLVNFQFVRRGRAGLNVRRQDQP